MFDPVKVNQNSIINLLNNPERVNSDIFSKKPEKDFFSMVMENKVNDDKKNITENKPNLTEETQKTSDKTESVKTVQQNTVSDNARNNSTNDRESNTQDSRKISQEHKEVNTEKNELKTADSKKTNDSQVKAVKSKSNKDNEEEISVINQLHGENNIKNLIDIIKAAVSGNKKAEEDSFRKLFSSLKFKPGKEYPGLTSSIKKDEPDKSHKNTIDLFSSITKELKDSISKEIFKNIENRKSAGKPQMLSDKELKELASDLIDGIKKSKSKDIVKHEAKIVSNDDLKNDKKLSVTADQPPAKKIETADDSSFEKNGSKEKNSGRDSFSYNGGKIDFGSKSGLEKMEHNLKNLDFKENLQEIIDKAKVTVRDSKNGAFTVRLNPQELGNVNVNLVMENGVITGKFLVDNEDVKSMLLSSLNDLKHQLEGAGIAVGEFSVNVNDQREKYLKQKDDERLNPISFLNSDKDLIVAAEQYNSAAAAHNGHINMVI